MKTTEQFVSDIIKKTKEKRKKRKIGRVLISILSLSILFFVVSFSNIISFDFSLYKNSYMKYLQPYCTIDENVGLKFLDGKSAVINIDDDAYPCTLKAKSKTEFVLNSVIKSDDDTKNLCDMPMEFSVKFNNNKAYLSYELKEKIVEKEMFVTSESEIPCGVWSLFAIKNGEEGELNSVSGAGWTLILENGNSYTGEGKSSAWVSKFVSIKNKLFQCMFDSKNDIILDASHVRYNMTDYEFPVLIERYISDGDPCYFYSKLLKSEELIDYNGGVFSAAGITYIANNQSCDKDEIFDRQAVKWNLLTKKEKALSVLNCNAILNLNNDGTVLLSFEGNSKYNDIVKGKWYALKNCILVVLDDKTSLTGKVFTLYVSGDRDFTVKNFKEQAISVIDLYSYYKVGYHWFDYYEYEENISIYWGEKWDKDYLLPKLIYNVPYVLNGTFIEEYYKPNFDYNNIDSYEQVDIPSNGMTIVFREDGTALITYITGESKTIDYYLDNYEGGTSIEFEKDIVLYQNGYGQKLSFRYIAIVVAGLNTSTHYGKIIIQDINFELRP